MTGLKARRGGLHLARLLFAIVLLPAVLAAAGQGQRQGLLWEIGGQGGAVSYLYGTIHSEDPSVTALAAPVRRAFEAADAVVLEALLDRDALLYSSRAMLLGDGRQLSQIAGSELFARAARAIAARGIPEVVLEHMKPWAAAVTLSMPAPETGQVLDMRLYEQALRDAKPVHGLETIAEQLEIFDALPERDQLLLLRDAVDNFPELDAMHAELLDAYRQRDLARLLEINHAAMQGGDPNLATQLQESMITRRNRLMAERMQPYLRSGNAFIAVGALHLPGETGLLALLEQRGYTLRVVY